MRMVLLKLVELTLTLLAPNAYDPTTKFPEVLVIEPLPGLTAPSENCATVDVPLLTVTVDPDTVTRLGFNKSVTTKFWLLVGSDM